MCAIFLCHTYPSIGIENLRFYLISLYRVSPSIGLLVFPSPYLCPVNNFFFPSIPTSFRSEKNYFFRVRKNKEKKFHFSVDLRWKSTSEALLRDYVMLRFQTPYPVCFLRLLFNFFHRLFLLMYPFFYVFLTSLPLFFEPIHASSSHPRSPNLFLRYRQNMLPSGQITINPFYIGEWGRKKIL